QLALLCGRLGGRRQASNIGPERLDESRVASQRGLLGLERVLNVDDGLRDAAWTMPIVERAEAIGQELASESDAPWADRRQLFQPRCQPQDRLAAVCDRRAFD